MGYNFFQKFPIMKGLEAEHLLQRFTRQSAKWTGQQAYRKGLGIPYETRNPFGAEQYYKETQRSGLSFRKQDVLYDYRRASTIEHSLSLTAKGNAEAWFESVLERIRSEKGLTQKQAIDVWSEMKRKQEELEGFTEEEGEYWKIYEGLW